jgi:hypothetical protein
VATSAPVSSRLAVSRVGGYGALAVVGRRCLLLGRVCLLAGSGWHIKNYERGFVARVAWLVGRTPHLGSRPPPHPPVTPIFIFGREPILSSLLLNQRRMMAMACRSSGGTSSKIRCAASCCDACDTVWWDSHASVRVAGTARNRMPLFVRLPASRVRACTERTPNLPRPGLLAPWHARRGRRQ